MRGVNSEREEKDKSKVVAGVKGRKKKERTLIQCKIPAHFVHRGPFYGLLHIQN